MSLRSAAFRSLSARLFAPARVPSLPRLLRTLVLLALCIGLPVFANAQIAAVTCTPSAILFGQSATATVSLSQPAHGYASIMLWNPGNTYQYITVPAGQTSASFTFWSRSVGPQVITAQADNSGTLTGQASCILYVTPTSKSLNPGNPPGSNSQQDPLCDGSVSAGINMRTGNVGIRHADPVATRGYPLTCNIHVHSQAVETARAMGNATFTYDMHVMQQMAYTAPGQGTLHWMLVDGDGTRLDFGPASSAPTATAGIFSRLTTTQTGYALANAGPPESAASAGNFAYQFNAAGQLTQIIDPAGNPQNLNYDANGRLTGVLDVNTGKQITFGYTGALITQVVENGGTATTTLGYQNGLLTALAVGNANGVATSVNYTYNADGTPATLTRDGDPASVLNFTYTPYTSRIGSTPIPMANETDATHTTHIGYGYLAQASNAVERTNVTNSYGGVTSYDYDAAGNLLQVTAPKPTGATQAPSAALTYNANLLPTSLTDGSLSVTSTYETNGLLASLTNYGQDTWRFTHNGADLLTGQDAVQAAAGVWERLTYGDANQPHIPTGYIDALGNAWSFAHNAFGQTTQVTPPPGSPTGPSSLAYDEQAGSATRGYALSAVDGNGNGITFDAYDPLGDLLQVSTYPVHGNTAVKNTLTMAYDAAQRLTLLTHPDGKTFQNAYVGRFLDHTIDEAGTQVNYYYCNVCDALLGASGPLGWGISWAYDGDHQLSAFTDAKGHSTTYAYGVAGELTRATLPDTATTTFLYNNVGLLRQVTNARGASTALAYDGAERLQQITFPTSSQATFTYAYNKDDTLKSVTDGAGVTTLTYAANGWVQSVITNYGASGLTPLQELDYAYYPDGSVHTLTWKSGGVVAGVWTYGYDAGGRLTSVVNGWGESTTWAYDGEGKLTGQTNQNGTSVSIGYNQARGWPTSVGYSNGGGTIATYALTYDGGANTIGLLTGVAENTGAQVTYGYDALYRLTSDTRVGTNAFTHAYGYDLAGNAQTLNGQAFGTYDAANKFSSLAGGSVGYDGDGDTTSAAGTSVPAGTWTWDDRSLLLSATSGANSVTYGYNAGGLRVWSQVSGGSKTFYIFSGSTLLGEVQNGIPAVAYTWGASGLVSERLLSANKSLWYCFGPQGETRQLTDSTGAVADTYLYSPYGTLLASTGTDTNPFRYGGQAGYYTDSNNPTGTILCGLRWYNPALGRWLSRDPIGYAGGVNLYEYCASNPIRFLDPFGMDVKIQSSAITITDIATSVNKTYQPFSSAQYQQLQAQLNFIKANDSYVQNPTFQNMVQQVLIVNAPGEWPHGDLHIELNPASYVIFWDPNFAASARNKTPDVLIMTDLYPKGIPAPAEFILAHELAHATGIQGITPAAERKCNELAKPILKAKKLGNLIQKGPIQKAPKPKHK